MAKESEHWCDRKHVPSEQIKIRKRSGHEDIVDQYRAWIGNFGKKLTVNQKQKFSNLYDEMISCKGIQI
jgi:hypothetical protein